MEAEVRQQRQLELGRDDERGVDEPEAPVEGADEDLEGRGAHGEDVLGEEEGRGERHVGEGADEEGGHGKREADYREVLEVPAVGGVDVVGVGGEAGDSQ